MLEEILIRWREATREEGFAEGPPRRPPEAGERVDMRIAK